MTFSNHIHSKPADRPWLASGQLRIAQETIDGRPAWVARDDQGVVAMATTLDDLGRVLADDHPHNRPQHGGV